MSPQVLRSHTRVQEVVFVRRIGWIVLTHVTEWGLSQIGKATGGFHHTTVLAGLREVSGAG